MKKEDITPTLYVKHICEVCGKEKPCFSVLSSWPYKGELMCGNKMVCKDCLEAGDQLRKPVQELGGETIIFPPEGGCRAIPWPPRDKS